jgi:hypothetical protein
MGGAGRFRGGNGGAEPEGAESKISIIQSTNWDVGMEKR